MQSISLEAVDLNLLRVFSAIHEERSVTRASARLEIGQPATSAALARLRQLFGDATPRKPAKNAKIAALARR